MKQRYGPQGCALLKTNTRPISADSGEQIPDPWGQYLHTHHLSTQVSIRDKPLLSDPAGFSFFSWVWSRTQSDRKGCGSGHSLRSGPSNACLLFWWYVLAADVAMVTLLQDLPEDVAASPAEKSAGAAGEVGHHSGNGEWS